MTVPSEVKLDRHTLDLDDNGHDTYVGTGFVSKIEGGQDTVKPHGPMGATETFDPTDGNVHTGTLNANCTVTLDPPTGAGGTTLIGWFTQSGGPWTLAFAASGGGSFAWNGATPTIPTTGTFRVVLERTPGTTNDWVGDLVGGGGGGSSLTVKDEGSSLDTAVTSIDAVGAGITATNTGHAVTLTVPGQTFTTPAIVLGTAAAAGAASTGIRSDSTIVAFDATAPTTQAFSDSAATGSAAVAARRDHKHGMPATPTSGGATDHEHIVNVVFSGDASTTVWELPAAPVDASAIAVYIAGSRSIAWVLSGTLLTTLTFDSAPASAANNIVIDIVAATA